MSRPPRIQYPGALYHVTSRGNRRARIFHDERDHLIWMDLVGATVERFGFVVHGFCMMTNHYHLTVQTTDANLSLGMHFLNSSYAQHFNKRHDLSGHVIQGRFHAVLVDRDTQLLELSRYVPLNPVRTRLAAAPQDWPWSSYRYFAGLANSPPWLHMGWTLGMFSNDPSQQFARFREFVHAGIGMPDPLLGATEYTNWKDAVVIPLREYEARYPDRDQAMAAAHASNGFTLQEIAEHFGVSTKTVGRAVKRYRK